MKILVAVKRVVDPYVRVRVKADHSGVDSHHAKMSINPFDEIALEEAVRLKEKGLAQEIVVVSLGGQGVPETLRHALALGADRALHVQADDSLETLCVAKALRAVVAQEQPQLVLLGKQAIDDDCNQVGQMLAALLGCAQATFASRIDLEQKTLTVVREVDGGLETVRLSLPAVITADLRLNTPRYASLPNIMKARQKPLTTLSLADLGVNEPVHLRLVKVMEPPVRKKGIIVATVTELVDRLRHEAKVIP
jgi:electron transfer flavoprotein beta subunit